MSVADLSQAQPKLRKVRTSRSDQEFLPAALAVLEVPPSPVRIALIWAIGALVVFSLSWTYFGRIDIIATAQGKIQPAGRVKTIQAIDGGRVVDIHVENGAHVTAGSVLLELDPTEAKADEVSSTRALQSYTAERLRRTAAIVAAEEGHLETVPQISWQDGISTDVRNREDRVLRGDWTHLKINLKSLDAQIEQKKAEVVRLLSTIAAQDALVSTLRERVGMREELFRRSAGSRASLIDALEGLQTQETSLATQKGQMVESQAAVAVLTEERQKVLATFLADYSQKLEEAERQIDDYEERVAKASARLSHMVIKAPVSGSVSGLSVTTKGQVVSSSEELMRIVPNESQIEIEGYLENRDIGFVEVGQKAIVKVESFPFTRYGTLDATVTRVAHDSIPEADAQSAEANAAKATKSAYFGGAQRVQNLYYPVTLKLDRHSMSVDGRDVALGPGMAVSVEIKTGRRRILEYLFSPIVETASKAMKER